MTKRKTHDRATKTTTGQAIIGQKYLFSCFMIRKADHQTPTHPQTVIAIKRIRSPRVTGGGINFAKTFVAKEKSSYGNHALSQNDTGRLSSPRQCLMKWSLSYFRGRAVLRGLCSAQYLKMDFGASAAPDGSSVSKLIIGEVSERLTGRSGGRLSRSEESGPCGDSESRLGGISGPPIVRPGIDPAVVQFLNPGCQTRSSPRRRPSSAPPSRNQRNYPTSRIMSSRSPNLKMVHRQQSSSRRSPLKGS